MKIKLTLSEAFDLRNSLSSETVNTLTDRDLTYAIEHSRRMLTTQLKKFQYSPSKEIREYNLKRTELDTKLNNKDLKDFEKKVIEEDIEKLDKEYDKYIKEIEKLEADFQEKLDKEFEFEVHGYDFDVYVGEITPAQQRAIFPILFSKLAK